MTRSRLAQRLESTLDGLITRKDIYSAILSVHSGDGDFRWSGSRGVTHPGGPAMSNSTPWFIASITKLFIASVAMRLVEDGELALEDRMVDRLPSAMTNRLHVLGGVDRTDQITIEHLLAHASGLPDFIEDYPVHRGSKGLDRRSLVEILVEDGDRAYSLDAVTERVREVLQPHFPPQRLHDRRVRIRYSDTNYQLLMGIVEARRDEPFARTLEELILDPLDLSTTWIPGHPRGADQEGDVAAVYAGHDLLRLPRFLASIADLNSTCGDLLRFMMAFEAGHLFKKPDTWHRMQTGFHTFSFPTDRAAFRQPGWPIEYGLGVMRFQLPRFMTPFRPVPQVVGHTGSTGTWLFHSPGLDLYLVGGVNQVAAGAVPFRVVPRILRATEENRPR